MTTFTNEQISMSVSVANSLTEEVCCFVNKDPAMLLLDMFEYIGDASVRNQPYNVDKYELLCKRS